MLRQLVSYNLLVLLTIYSIFNKNTLNVLIHFTY